MTIEVQRIFLAVVSSALIAHLNPSSLHAQVTSLPDSLSLDFSIDRIDQAGQAVVYGISNGISYTATPTEGGTIFMPFTNLEDDQVFKDLPGSFDAIHSGSNIRLIFEKDIRALLVATANDNDTGDGFDFGIIPTFQIDLSISNTYMASRDKSGTLALLITDGPMREWTSLSDDMINDGIDLAFFAFEEWPPKMTETQTIAEELEQNRSVELDIQFEFNSDIPTSDGFQRIGRFAEAVRQLFEDVPQLRIIGHTDAVGSDTYNLSLSERRANSVRRILIEDHRFPASFLTAQGMGERALKYPDDPEADGNRRVEIRLDEP